MEEMQCHEEADSWPTPEEYALEMNGTQSQEIDLGEMFGLPVTQIYGQQYYGPPKDFVGPAPEIGSQIYMKIPLDAFAQELIPLIQDIVGEIYQMRLIVDGMGDKCQNRGFTYVTFYSSEDADKAISALNGFQIRTRFRLEVKKFIDNCRLFIGGVPKTLTRSQFLHAMMKVTSGVKGVILFSHKADPNKNPGYGFVEYNCYKDAALARSKMVLGKIKLWGRNLIVNWAKNKFSFLEPFCTVNSIAEIPQWNEPMPMELFSYPYELPGNVEENFYPEQEESSYSSQECQCQECQCQEEPIPYEWMPSQYPFPSGIHIPQEILDQQAMILVMPFKVPCVAGCQSWNQTPVDHAPTEMDIRGSTHNAEE